MPAAEWKVARRQTSVTPGHWEQTTVITYVKNRGGGLQEVQRWIGLAKLIIQKKKKKTYALMNLVDRCMGTVRVEKYSTMYGLFRFQCTFNVLLIGTDRIRGCLNEPNFF